MRSFGGKHRHRFARTVATVSGTIVLLVGSVRAQGQPPSGALNPAPLVERLLDRADRFLTPRCLTPDVGHVIEALLAAGTLKATLGSEFKLEKVDIGASALVIEIQNDAGRAYAVTLALSKSKDAKVDAEGKRFVFYLKPTSAPANPQATAALLAVAKLLDESVPETALQRCAGGDEGRKEGSGPIPSEEPRYPRELALGTAVFEVLILAGALVFGLRAIRTPRPTAGNDS